MAYYLQGNDGLRFGFLADEVQKVLPQITRLSSQRQGIMYLDLLAVLACSMQELTEEMDAVVARLSFLEGRIEERQRRLSAKRTSGARLT